jgi:hypothetical protein
VSDRAVDVYIELLEEGLLEEPERVVVSILAVGSQLQRALQSSELHTLCASRGCRSEPNSAA